MSNLGTESTAAVERHAPVSVPVPEPIATDGAVRLAGRRTWLPTFFFVTGGHKCGTSWLSWMIDSHPHVVCRSAGRFLGVPGSSEKWLNRKKIREWGAFHTVAESWLAGVDEDEVDLAMRRAMLEAVMMLRTPVGVRAVGDKTPMFYLREAPKLKKLFPESTLTAIIRDGRDACVSHAFHMLRRDEPGAWEDDAAFAAARAHHVDGTGPAAPLFNEAVVRHTAENWCTTARGSLRARQTFGRNYIELRYEDLLVDPAPHLARVFEAIGVEASEKTVATCVEANSFEAKSGGRKPGEADPDSFVRKGVAGDWKNHFRDADRTIFKDVAGDELIALGYEQDGGW